MRNLLLVVMTFTVISVNAQFVSSPTTLDGTISANEYGNHTNGVNAWSDGSRTWYMAWDNTNLYIAVNANGNASNDEMVLYIDTDPSIPVTGGTGATGGTGNFGGNNYGRLPFSANFNAYIRNNFHQHRSNAGTNWGTSTNNDALIQKTTLGDVQEIQIDWSLMGGRPASFNIFFYLNGGQPYGGASNYSNDNDQSNGLNLTGRVYFGISNTSNGSSTAPFSRFSYCNPRPGNNVISNYGSSFYDVTLSTGTTGFAILSTINAALTINNNFYIDGYDGISQNNNAMQIGGNITRMQPFGVLDASNMGAISFIGSNDQTQTGNITYNGGLTINKPGGRLILASNGSNIGMNIDNNSTLTLTSGVIDSRTNNTLVEIRNGSTTTSGNAFSFIDGNLQINNIGAAPRIFAVGRTTYNPATIANTGTADNFTMNVGNYLTFDGTEFGLQGDNQVVNRTWNVSEATAGGSTVSLTVQWNSNAIEELMGFNASQCYVGHFTGGVWLSDNASTAGVGNLASTRTQTRNSLTSFSPFGVASAFALPLKLKSFTAQKINQGTQLNWATESTQGNVAYQLEYSHNSIDFMPVYSIVSAQNNHQFIDVVRSGTVFYRLSMREVNGMVKYAPILKLAEKETNMFQVIPTNSKNEFLVRVNSEQNSQLSIWNSTGQLIKKLPISTGISNTSLSLNHLKAGIYFIKLTTIGLDNPPQKLVIQ